MQPLTMMSKKFIQLAQSVYQVRDIKKGALLYHEGLEAEEIFLIKSGKIQISKVTSTGQVLALRLCSAGDLIGELTLFSSSKNYIFSAKIIEEGEVIAINKKKLERRLETNHELAFEFMKWANHQNLKTQIKFRDLLLAGKKGALYSTLIRLSNSYGKKLDNGIFIDLYLTHQQLANFCATSREVVHRILRDLRKNEIISVHKGYITIKNLDYLKKAMNCENCPIDICNIN